MPYEKTRKLVVMLAKRTAGGHVAWEETNEENVFQAAFPGYAVRVAAKDEEDGVSYTVHLHNESGQLIEEIRSVDIREDDSRGAYQEAYELMRSLYEGARRRAMGVEEALDQILSKLEEDDVPF
jgi:hypothetical protein